MKIPFLNKIEHKKEFNISLNKGVFSTTFVMLENSPITFVSHELDGDWQFMGDEPIQDYKKTGLIVALSEIIKKDGSVLNIADLPMGYQASRLTKKSKWKIERIEYSDDEIKEFGFYCSECGKYHRDLPFSYVADAPVSYYQLENKANSQLTKDICIIDEKRFFIKGQIIIKVVDSVSNFLWIVWVEISRNDFYDIQEHWADENRFLKEPYQGRLDTIITVYPGTVGLNVSVQTEKMGLLPRIFIEDENHPIFLEQETGIDNLRVTEFARKIMYSHEQ